VLVLPREVSEAHPRDQRAVEIQSGSDAPDAGSAYLPQRGSVPASGGSFSRHEVGGVADGGRRYLNMEDLKEHKGTPLKRARKEGLHETMLRGVSW
jgi:hypothetical protein